MFNCGNCLKSDVCRKNAVTKSILKDLELNKMVQTLKGNGFTFNIECVNYQATTVSPRVLGGNYEQ